MIDKYQFGEITINGETFENDVEVRWNGEVLEWWREEGHVFAVTDLKRAVEQDPDAIVLGIGANGKVKVPKETKTFLKEKDIKLVIDKTPAAVKSFELLVEEGNEKAPKKVVGLFHLTC